MDSKAFSDFFDELGTFSYPILSEIKFKSTDDDVAYSVKLKEGEQKLDGSQVIDLIRYYIDEENNTSLANDIVLNSMLQQINSDNVDNGESLFKMLMTSAETNITVKDYSSAKDNLTVLSHQQNTGTYSAVAEYNGNTISPDSLQKLKGYFVK
jgi:anionic cell wall polymer biosynthesis LytR-Cps2A-Psr (LCP) family protein